jgi:small subunit ribosomal protein S6
MKRYETIFLTRPDLSVNQNENLTNNFLDILKKYDATVKNVEYAGLRSLAYRIKKNKKAHYTLLNIESSNNEAISEMERNMRINEDVLRYLTINVEEFSESPSPLSSFKSKENRRYESSDSVDNASAGES